MKKEEKLFDSKPELLPVHFIEEPFGRLPGYTGDAREDDRDDLELIRRVAVQDRQAFGILYNRYAPLVSRYLSFQIRRRELVEETLNDVMMVVWETASRFNGTSKLSTWILGIAHNKALKAWTRVARADRAELPEDNRGDVETNSPEKIVREKELAHLVRRAVDSLPAEQRAVIVLTFYNDLPQAEIAKILGCPVNTVKTRLFHARQRLFADTSINALKGLDDVKAYQY
jgi:RNA polymerase sigma factor (sigma-70 family)